ncbi:MAG: GNAT family N-acetyltransferase [Candidatus Thorarchaeota archaeon]
MVKTRPLRESDREDILDIARNTWDGHDYLPHYFDEWLKDLTCHPMAIEENSRVAALANLKIIDDGMTGWMEGLRVHPDYRGRGYASSITDLLVTMAKDLGVKRVRYTTAIDNYESLHLADKIGMKRIFRMGVFWEPNLDKMEINVDIENLSQLDIEQECNSVISSGLIPNNVIVIDWKAFDVSPYIFSMFEEVEIWSHVVEEHLQSLSVGALRYDMHDTVWAFTIYTNHANLFLQQMSKQIELAKKKKLDRIMMIFPYDFYSELNKFEWMQDEEYPDFGLFLLEKKL